MSVTREKSHDYNQEFSHGYSCDLGNRSRGLGASKSASRHRKHIRFIKPHHPWWGRLDLFISSSYPAIGGLPKRREKKERIKVALDKRRVLSEWVPNRQSVYIFETQILR